MYGWATAHCQITRAGEMAALFSLFIGALVTGFFWKCGIIYVSKWVYTVPFVNVAHILRCLHWDTEAICHLPLNYLLYTTYASVFWG